MEESDQYSLKLLSSVNYSINMLAKVLDQKNK